MKKAYNKTELEAFAKKVFKNNPTAKKAFATSDGNVFLMQNRAKLHAGAKGTVLTFVNDTIQVEATAKTDAKGNTDIAKAAANKLDDTAKAEKAKKMQKAKAAAKALVTKIGALATVEEVNAAIEGSKAKSVIAAAEARITELKAVTAEATKSTSEKED